MISRNVYERALNDFWGPILGLLRDPEITEVVMNGPARVYVERAGRMEPTSASLSPEQLLGALRVVAQFAGRHFDEQRPILEARLPDGSRLEAVLSPVAQDGPCVAIRKHQTSLLTPERLIELGALSCEAYDALSVFVREKKNILVSGGTGSGKTSLLRCLALFASPGERIVVLEDARELEIPLNHVVSLETRPADPRGLGAVTMTDLFRATLRLRPDRIVMGEVRGPEALELVQAMNSGHGGCLSTIHASSPVGALRRLETLALGASGDIPLVALRSQVAAAVEVIVQTERLSNGRRGVTEVARVLPLSVHGDFALEPLFVRRGASLERAGHHG